MPFRAYLPKDELESLRGNIAPLKDAFDLLADHVVITDKNGIILYANEAVERNTGYAVEEMAGKNPGDLWGGAMSQEFYEHMWRVIKDEKKPFTGEVRNRRKDGVEYWQELHITPVLDESGEARFFIGIEPNITDRKEKEKFREEFTSILGHQLKNPLAAIKWSLEWLLRGHALTDEQRKTLEQVYENNTSLIGLVSDLIVLSRVGDMGQASEEFDLGDEIQSVIESIRKKEPDVAISFDRSGGVFPLRAHKTLTRQVLVNIISNGAEYADKERGEVAVILRREGDGYYFSCENNGIGIPVEDQPKIFSRFFRASNAAAIKEKGTGLGLYIVKMICGSFGWRVSFKSPARDDGTDTVFFVTIPIR